MYKSISVLFLLITLYGCGVSHLKQADYDRVRAGEMALLITDNPGLIDPIDLALFGEETSVTITQIDENKIDHEFLKNDQHVLVEPGNHIISVLCDVRKRGKNVSTITKSGVKMHKLEAGNIYRIRPISFKDDHEPCDFELVINNDISLKNLDAENDQAFEPHEY